MMIDVVGTALVIAIVVAIGMYLDKRLRVDIKPDPPKRGARIPPPVGDTPATAIRAGAAQLANLRASQRCTNCRQLLEADGPDEELRYAERPLLLLHFHCPTCLRKRSLYVIPAA